MRRATESRSPPTRRPGSLGAISARRSRIHRCLPAVPRRSPPIALNKVPSAYVGLLPDTKPAKSCGNREFISLQVWTCGLSPRPLPLARTVCGRASSMRRSAIPLRADTRDSGVAGSSTWMAVATSSRNLRSSRASLNWYSPWPMSPSTLWSCHKSSMNSRLDRSASGQACTSSNIALRSAIRRCAFLSAATCFPARSHAASSFSSRYTAMGVFVRLILGLIEATVHRRVRHGRSTLRSLEYCRCLGGHWTDGR